MHCYSEISLDSKFVEICAPIHDHKNSVLCASLCPACYAWLISFQTLSYMLLLVRSKECAMNALMCSTILTIQLHTGWAACKYICLSKITMISKYVLNQVLKMPALHALVRAENTRLSLVNYDPMLKVTGANTSDQHSQCKHINIHNTNGIGLFGESFIYFIRYTAVSTHNCVLFLLSCMCTSCTQAVNPFVPFTTEF